MPATTKRTPQRVGTVFAACALTAPALVSIKAGPAQAAEPTHSEKLLFDGGSDLDHTSTAHRSIVFRKVNLPWILNGRSERCPA